MKQLDKVSLLNRFAYLDNIRSLAIIHVIAIHAAVTYSGLGGWYYIEGSPLRLSLFEKIFFGFYQSFLQAWLMGALFFISAYLVTKSLVKHGSLNFIRERLFRLGMPLLIYVFIVSPFIEIVLLRGYTGNNFINKLKYYMLNLKWIGATGPLWYVQTLLVFCVIYVIFRKIFTKNIVIKNISQYNIIFVILLTGIIAFFIRLIFPIGYSFYNLQFGYFSSYIVMFIAGIIIGENDLLNNITDEKNIKWLMISLIIGIPFWAIIMIFGGALEGKMYINGGFYWQNMAFALWESLTAIGFSTGIIALFKKKVNILNKLTGLLRGNAFGLYFFHAPILLIISLALKGWVFYPVLKFFTVLIIAIIVNLIFSYLIRKIKPFGILFR